MKRSTSGTPEPWGCAVTRANVNMDVNLLVAVSPVRAPSRILQKNKRNRGAVPDRRQRMWVFPLNTTADAELRREHNIGPRGRND